MNAFRETGQSIIDFLYLCLVFAVVFGFVIGGGILFFRLIYMMVS